MDREIHDWLRSLESRIAELEDKVDPKPQPAPDPDSSPSSFSVG